MTILATPLTPLLLFRNADERDGVKWQVQRVEAATRLLEAIRSNPAMADYKLTTDLPPLPSVPELVEAAVVLGRVAACLRHMHDRRCRPGDDVPLGQGGEDDMDETPF